MFNKIISSINIVGFSDLEKDRLQIQIDNNFSEISEELEKGKNKNIKFLFFVIFMCLIFSSIFYFTTSTGWPDYNRIPFSTALLIGFSLGFPLLMFYVFFIHNKDFINDFNLKIKNMIFLFNNKSITMEDNSIFITDIYNIGLIKTFGSNSGDESIQKMKLNNENYIFFHLIGQKRYGRTVKIIENCFIIKIIFDFNLNNKDENQLKSILNSYNTKFNYLILGDSLYLKHNNSHLFYLLKLFILNFICAVNFNYSIKKLLVENINKHVLIKDSIDIVNKIKMLGDFK